MLERELGLYKIATVNGFSAPLLTGLVSCVIVIMVVRPVMWVDVFVGGERFVLGMCKVYASFVRSTR